MKASEDEKDVKQLIDNCLIETIKKGGDAAIQAAKLLDKRQKFDQIAEFQKQLLNIK